MRVLEVDAASMPICFGDYAPETPQTLSDIMLLSSFVAVLGSESLRRTGQVYQLQNIRHIFWLFLQPIPAYTHLESTTPNRLTAEGPVSEW